MERMVAELEQLGTVADGSDTGEDPGQLTNIFQRTKTGRMKFTPSGVPSISKDRLEAKLQEIVAAADVDIEMPRTAKTKKLSTSAKYWAQYRHLHPFIDRWVELTEISKLLQFCGKMVGERVRPHYTVLVRTGRTSCSKPNIQQLPTICLPSTTALLSCERWPRYACIGTANPSSPRLSGRESIRTVTPRRCSRA